MSDSKQMSALVKKPIRLIVTRQGQQMSDQMYQHTPIRIGRLLDNDLVLPFDFASRFHAELRFENGQWRAIDLGSKNGLLFGPPGAQTRLQEIPLEDGQSFTIQEVTIQLVNEVSAAVAEDFHSIRDAETFFGDADELKRAVRESAPMPAQTSSPTAAATSMAPRSTFAQGRNSPTPTSIDPNYMAAAVSGLAQTQNSQTQRGQTTTPTQSPTRSVTSNKSAPTQSARQTPSTPPASQPSASSAASSAASSGTAPSLGRDPILDIDIDALFCQPHADASNVKERALQVVVLWHDQILDAKEIPIGEPVTWEFLGQELELGDARRDKTTLRLPKGCVPIGGDPARASVLTVTWDEPAAFRVSDALTVSIRYVPKSRELARKVGFVEERLVDPLLLSSAVHGSAALTAILMAPKHPPAPRVEPERFATIIIAAPPPEVVLQATPTPPPEPTPEPTPIVAKKEPEPKKEAKKVVTEKKLKKIAVAKTKDPKPVIKEAKPAPKMAAQPKAKPEVVKVLAKAEPPPPVPVPPAPAPTPLPFNAKSVGALKMLSMLSTTGPATHMANVDHIQVSRAPASVPGTWIGREAVSGTGDMISKLAQSASGGGKGKRDAGGVAVGGKNAGGQYQTAGLSGTAGKAKIKGTVTGGATYTELSKNEGLTSEQVMKVVRKNESKIQQCYEKSLLDNPDLAGSAEFEWEISGPGNVNFVNVKNAALKGGENLLDCVKGVFKAMKFPAAKNGENTTSTIGLPFGRL